MKFTAPAAAPLSTAMAGRFDTATMTALPAWTCAQLIPGTRHARADGETGIQLHGTGPWRLPDIHPVHDPSRARP